MRYNTLIFIVLFCVVLPANAQKSHSGQALEICDNGLDDDADGYVDCYDADCHCFNGPACSVKELPFDFKVRLAWQSTQNNPFITATPVVANMNPGQDSMPEIIVGAAGPGGYTNPNRIFFYRGDGSNAANPAILTVPGGFNPYPVPGPTIGDVNHDGVPELIMSCNDGRIRVFTNYTGALTAPMTLWTTSTGSLDFEDQRPFLADFNGDGIAEIYAGNDIFQFNFSNPFSPTLSKVINGNGNMGQAVYNLYQEGSCNPTAADLLSVADCNGDPDCAGLELAAGPVIYSIDLDPNDGDGYQIKVKRDLNQLVSGGNYDDGYTAVADIDLDGVLDVVVSGRRGNNQMGVYAWNKNGLLRFFPYPNGSVRSGSLACIANFYDDRTAGFTRDLPEIVVCNSYNLNCFNLQAAQVTPSAPYWWSLTTEDYSGFTGASVYDFNGDGIFELVYRDEDNLRILYGGPAPFPPGVDTERNWYKIACGSITSDEYPIVADVDNDGETEIAVTGYPFSGYNTPPTDYRGRLRVFESDADPWMPCRNVWNQYNYFVVNVNDDLSIPAQQQLHHLELPAAGSNNRPLNRYLSQRPLFDENFEPFLPVADALAAVEDVRCAGDSLTVRLRICNQGSKALPAGTPLAFYRSDPTASDAALLYAGPMFAQALPRDSCGSFLFKIPRAAGTVYGVVNDNGAHARPFKLDADFPVTNVYECLWPNNIFQFETDFPQVHLDTVNGDCFGKPGAATATASGKNTPLGYAWSGGFSGPVISGVPDGLYTVTVTDARACTASDSTRVQAGAWLEAQTAATSPPCFGQTTGSAAVTVLNGTPDYSFAWSNSATTPDIQAIGAGNYTVTVSYGSGKCAQVFELQVTEPLPLLSAGVAATAACPGEANGTLAFSGAAQGTPPYALLWSNSASGAGQGALPAGTYTLTVTDAKGCSLTETAEVPEWVAPAVAPAVSHVSCFGAQDGAVALSIAGGSPGFGFLWSNQDTTADLQHLGPGNYALTLTYAGGQCTQTLAVQLTEPPPLLSAGTGATAACPGVANGTASFAGAAQGTPPYALQWSTGGTTNALDGLFAGTYTLTVTDAQGCSLLETVQVPAWIAPALSATVAPVSCSGRADGRISTALAGGSPGFGFAWSNSATGADLENLGPGNYALTLTYAGGQCADTYAFTVTEPLPLLSQGINATAVCKGSANGSLSFAGASQGTPPYTLLWSTGAGSADLSGLSAGTYTLTVTDAQGCSLTESATVSEHAALSLLATPKDPLCAGSQDGSIDLQPGAGTPPYSFIWSGGQSSEDLNALVAGTYAVTVTDAQGCTQGLQIALGQPLPLLSQGTSATAACPGVANGTASFAGAAQGTPPYALQWSTGSTTGALDGLFAGTYTLTITDAQGCSLLETVQVPAWIAPALSATVAPVSCSGSADGRISTALAGGSPGFGFAWSNSATGANLENLGPGNYALTLTYAGGQCADMFAFTVTEPLPLLSQGINTTAVCKGGANGSLSFAGASQGTPPYTLLWSTGAGSASLSGLSAGTYTLTVTDAQGCSLTESATVAEHATLSLLATPKDPLCAGGQDGSIDLQPGAGTPPYNFIWSGGQSSEDLNALAAGTYAVTVTDAYGCTQGLQIALGQPLPLLSQGTSAKAACPGVANGSASFNGAGQGTPPYTLLWSTGSATATITGLGAGVYPLTITDAHGCTLPDTAWVPEYPGMSLSATGQDLLCAGGQDGGIDLNVAGGTAPFAFHWSGGQASEDLSTLAAGNYQLTVTDAHGCTGTYALSLTAPPALNLQAAIRADTCETGDGSISLSASGGTAPYGYGWSTGSAQAALAGLPAGTYIVTLTDAHGCTLTRDAAVPAYGKIPVLSPFTDTITCATPVAQIGATADQSNLYYTWSGPAGPLPHLANIPVAVPGTYTVKAVNAQGCTQTALLTVAEDRKKPVANAGAASVTAPCSATSVWLDAGASSSGPGFLNRWRGVSGGLLILDTAALKIAVQQAGWYTHTVQNLANGCTAADSVRVDWEAPIEAVFVLDSISCFGENDGRIQLKQVSGGKAPYFYSIDNQNFTTKNTFKNLSPGTYLLIVRDTFGCHWETMVVLSEPPALSVQLSASDTVIERGQFLYLEAVPSPPGVALSSVVWQPAGFDFTPGKLRQHVRPLENTEFSIQIFDLHGCPASDRIAVRVDNFQIYVPNVIYPGRPQNGAFTIFAGDGVTDIRLMRIYDRWGSLVFEKQHFAPNDLGLGWNGTDRGTPVNPGVFAWYAEVELRDGQRRLLKGDVTVLR